MGGQSKKRRFIDVWAWKEELEGHIDVSTKEPKKNKWGTLANTTPTLIDPGIFRDLTGIETNYEEGMDLIRLRIPVWREIDSGKVKP